MKYIQKFLSNKSSDLITNDPTTTLLAFHIERIKLI